MHSPHVPLRLDRGPLDDRRPVWVYGDGSGQGWSIAQNGRRIGYFDRAVLRDVRFVIQRGVLANVKREMRNIHAFAEGWLDDWPSDNAVPSGVQQVRYRPDLGFYAGTATDLQLCAAEAVYFDTHFPLGVGLQLGLAIDPGGEHIAL